MNNYSKGVFTHQSLRVEKETLLMLREHCAANNLFMAHFADDAIKEKIKRDKETQAEDHWRKIFNTEPPEDFGKLV